MGADFIEAEKRLRKIISNSTFTFNGKKYKAGKAYKPQKQGSGGETKTDAYFIAKNLVNNTNEEFKISYKKTTFSFVENKLPKKNAPGVYGKNWSNEIKKRTTSLMDKFKEEAVFYQTAKDLPSNSVKRPSHVYPGSIVLGWRHEFEAKKGKNGRKLSYLETKELAGTLWSGKNKLPEYKNGIVKELDSEPITSSGEPNHFLKMKIPDETIPVNEIFEKLKSLEQVKQEYNIYSAFIAHSYDPINMKQHGGTGRDLAVVVDWKEKNGKLTANLNFENPLETNSNTSRDEIKKIIKDFDLEVGKNFDIKKFKEILEPSILTYNKICKCESCRSGLFSPYC